MDPDQLTIKEVTERLRRIQEELEEDDLTFAARLHVPRVSWTTARLGTRPLTGAALLGALNAFPRLYRSRQARLRGEVV